METLTDPYAIAKAGLCHYSGDVHPLDYDGAWYESSDWQKDGYANCVRVSCMPEGPDCIWCRVVILELLTINKPKPVDLKRALESVGLDTASSITPEMEIEACLGYGFYDPNDSNWHTAQSHHLVVVEDGQELTSGDRAAIDQYCRIHGAKAATEDTAWGILCDWVGVHSCNP